MGTMCYLLHRRENQRLLRPHKRQCVQASKSEFCTFITKGNPPLGKQRCIKARIDAAIARIKADAQHASGVQCALTACVSTHSTSKTGHGLIHCLYAARAYLRCSPRIARVSSSTQLALLLVSRPQKPNSEQNKQYHCKYSSYNSSNNGACFARMRCWYHCRWRRYRAR